MRLCTLPLLFLPGLMFTTSLTNGHVFTIQQEEDVVSFTESLRECRGVVGVTVAVVKGNNSWARGFGVADVATGEKVTSSHLFGIASLTKAFTAALLSLFLNSTNRYSWDTPVVEILGEDFEFINEQLTQQVTLKDMLTHRTGLESLDLPLIAGVSLNMKTLAKGMRHLPIEAEFRDKFDYNNWMYSLLGRVTEVLGGAPWEDLLYERLLKPLSMTRSRVLGKTVMATDDSMAKPYVMLGEEVVLSDAAIYNMTPHVGGGSIASSADDMINWLHMLLNKGASRKGQQVISEKHLPEMTTAHMGQSTFFRQVYSLWKPQYPVTFSNEGYGYGWKTASYRGYPVTWHSGGFFGYTSYLAIVPDFDVAFFINNNGPGRSPNKTDYNDMVFYYVADLLMQEKSWLNLSNACQFPKPWIPQLSQTEPTTPTVYDNPAFGNNAEKYAGRYGHPLYGELKVERNGAQGLKLRYYLLEARLFRGEEEDVAMGEVEGILAFEFLYGDERSYLKLEFSRPLNQGPFQKVMLTWYSEKIVFVRDSNLG